MCVTHLGCRTHAHNKGSKEILKRAINILELLAGSVLATDNDKILKSSSLSLPSKQLTAPFVSSPTSCFTPSFLLCISGSYCCLESESLFFIFSSDPWWIHRCSSFLIPASVNTCLPWTGCESAPTLYLCVCSAGV